MQKNFKTLCIFSVVILSSFVSCKNDKGENNPKSKSPKIVIVGAGASGIAAASKLFEYGFGDVTILEAEDRIGGRIYTTSFGNYSVDLGAQWIHGEVGNAAFELANPLGLVDKSNSPDFDLEQEYIDSSGNPLDVELSKEISEFLMTYVIGAVFENNTAYKSIGEYAEKMFTEKFKNHPEILKDKRKYLRHLESTRLSSESADSWCDISAKGLMQYRTCFGDQLINWKKRGYSTVLDILTKRLPNPENELPVRNNTLLNTEVVSIDYLQNSEGPSILITVSNGKLFKADHVIVTVSLGVLKDKHMSFFIPPLPDYKISTIEGLGFGDVAKILFRFDEPFWQLGNRRILSFTFIWNEEERRVIEDDPEKNWLLGILGAMTVEHKPNLLSLWITGKYAKAMETLTEDKVFHHAAEHLQRFLGKKYKIAPPVAMLRSQWYTNPHFRGTYSYRSLESEKRNVYAEMLEKPVSNMKILFAGEATSPDRFSTVDGAISSGWKAAYRLKSYYKLD